MCMCVCVCAQIFFFIYIILVVVVEVVVFRRQPSKRTREPDTHKKYLKHVYNLYVYVNSARFQYP